MEKLLNIIDRISPEIKKHFEISGYLLKQITKSSSIAIEKSSHGYHLELTDTQGAMNFFPVVTSSKYLDTKETVEKRRFQVKLPLSIDKNNLKSLLETVSKRAAEASFKLKTDENSINNKIKNVTDLEAFISSNTRCSFNIRSAGQYQMEVGTSKDDESFLDLRSSLIPEDYLLFLKKKDKIDYVVLGISKEMYADFNQYFTENPTVFQGAEKDILEGNQIVDTLADNTILSNISNKLNQIFYGPPGTGKTYLVKGLALKICSLGRGVKLQESFGDAIENGFIEFLTFHQSYSYEEFVEGIKPVLIKGQLEYKIVDGIFKKFCEKAEKKTDQNFVLIIDEINRGNISKIFGELITLIEESKRVGTNEELRLKLAYSGAEGDNKLFGVPNNVFILGTMNTADKSIALIDTALRRRFSFVEVPPDPSLLVDKLDVVNLQSLLETINQRISYLLDNDHLIGHSYFMKIESLKDLRDCFVEKIIPLLKEYFYGDFEKIQIVLGDNSEWKKNDKYKIIKAESEDKQKEVFGEGFNEYDEKTVYTLNPAFNKSDANFGNAEVFKEYFTFIYQKHSDSNQ